MKKRRRAEGVGRRAKKTDKILRVKEYANAVIILTYQDGTTETIRR